MVNPFRGALVNIVNTTQVFTTGVASNVQFAAEVYDTSAIHDNVANNTRLTVPAGVTKVRLSGGAVLNWAGGTHITHLYKNGVTTYIGSTFDISGNTIGGKSQGQINSPVLQVVAGDYFELNLEQFSGSNKSLNDTDSTWFSMEIVE